MDLFDLYQSKCDELYETISPTKEITFKMPIQYVNHSEINSIIKSDLELSKTYINLVSDSMLINNWTSYYTTNKQFLKDTQKHIANIKPLEPNVNVNVNILSEYTTFKSETSFIEKFNYIGLKMFKNLNYSPTFLHGLGLYNLAAPVISLFSPILALIVPFIILKLRRIPITISDYITFLKTMITQNSIYKLFTNFTEISAQQRMTTIITLFFYFFQIYSNIMSCLSFYKNIHSISAFLHNYKNYIEQSVINMNVLQSTLKYKSYIQFNADIDLHKSRLHALYLRLNTILPYKNTISKIGQLGIIMNLNYELFIKQEYHESFMFSIYLQQYIQDVNHIKSLGLHKCKFINKMNKCTKLTSMYYLPHIQETYVTNDIDLSQNIIITGPNASGKTTILKSLLINLLLSQQIGYGCYKTANIKLYDIFHSYLNIPDTSGRDSLFQAEARRCKDILVSIVENPTKSHCCIFDEIYSGTNPNDAIMCASLYLDKLNDFKSSVDYVLTTHYIQLCENFDKNLFNLNLKMNVNVLEDKIEYLYLMVPGISYIHGGKQVIKELNYPLFSL